MIYLKNRRTGSVFVVLGSAPSTTDPRQATVWVQKADQPRACLPWSVNSMMSGYHDFVAVDEHGKEQERPDARP